MIRKLFGKRLNTQKNHLISKFTPLTLGPKTQFARKMEFSTSSYSKELVDPPKNPIQTYEIYFDIKKNQDNLIFETSGIKCNLFVIFPKTIGRELNKTTAFTTTLQNNPKDTIFEIINSQGYFILENKTNPKEIKLIKVQKHSLVFIPKEFAFTIINTSKTENMLCINFTAKQTTINGNNLLNSNGNVIYLLEKGFIKNQNASSAYNLEEIENDYLLDYNFSKEKGLYHEFLELPGKFNFLK